MWTFQVTITIGNRTFTVNLEPFVRWLVPDWMAMRLGLPCPYDPDSADPKERARASRYESATRFLGKDKNPVDHEPDRSNFYFKTFAIDRKGKWFYCWSWWLFPKSLVEQIRAQVQTDIIDYNLYSNQPSWSLLDIEASSFSEASEIIREFLNFVKFTSAEFGWRHGFPGHHRQDLEDHSWKLVTFRDIEKAAKAGNWRKKSDKDLVDLFQKAAHGVPEAVARLSHIFPTNDEWLQAKEEARQLFTLEKFSPEKIDRVMRAEELAAVLANTAVRDPDSDEAQTTRQLLRRLVSKGAAKGSGKTAGRPPMLFSDYLVEIAFTIGYGLSKQLRDVESLLARWEPSTRQRLALLRDFYPWVERVETPTNNLQSLLGMQPSQAACIIAGAGLGISPSKVEKAVYKTDLA